MKRLHVVCSDLEGVWVPEVWINVAEKTGIPELRLTTRDIKNYDELMRHRLGILKEKKITLRDIQNVISTIPALDGAKEMIEWMTQKTRLIIVSDTFVEFADPLMAKLGRPVLFCHSLETDCNGMITGYNLRQKDGKKEVVRAMKSLNFETYAFGDSYNDINMLREAEHGILFSPPKNVADDHPEFPVFYDYGEMKRYLEEVL